MSDAYARRTAQFRVRQGLNKKRTNNSTEQRYRAIVFKHGPPTADFSCSTQVVLPGRHSEQDAWAAVYAALRTGDYIGGEIRFAEMRAEKDAENRS